MIIPRTMGSNCFRIFRFALQGFHDSNENMQQHHGRHNEKHRNFPVHVVDKGSHSVLFDQPGEFQEDSAGMLTAKHKSITSR